jgi:Glycosyl transferase family 2
VELETPLPSDLDVGLGTALFLYGRAEHNRGRITSLDISVDGKAEPVIAHGMPRGDPSSSMSGFWGIAPLPRADGARTATLDLVATLDGGEIARRSIGEVRIQPGPARAHLAEPGIGDAVQIAICMATLDPPIELFRRQVESIRGQTYPDWICVISDDGSRDEVIAEMTETIGGDPRFALSRSPQRLGFYGNFERTLSLIPETAGYVALADQDDRWYPEKLEVLRAALQPGSTLAYSDMRIVSPEGEVESDTYWTHRANNSTDLGSLLIMNSITGAASLFRRELLAHVLPFPPRLGPHAYHDHWIAATALALGEVSYVDRPLYDYVQHGAAALGHGKARRRLPLRERRGSLDRVWREAHFSDYCQLLLSGRVLSLRGEARIEPAKRRSLELVAGGSPAARATRLALRALRPITRRSRTPGAERRLLRGMAWPPAIRCLAQLPPRGRRQLHANLPPSVRDVLDDG